MVICYVEAYLEAALNDIHKAMAEFGLQLNKEKSEILSLDKNCKTTSLCGIKVKKYVKNLRHHISADFKANMIIALNKAIKNTRRLRR